MRARYVLFILCISLNITSLTAEEEDDLPPLELLGFIADFSDEDEGWTDPHEINTMLPIDGQEAETTADVEATKPVETGLAEQKKDAGIDETERGRHREPEQAAEPTITGTEAETAQGTLNEENDG
jgi:hypothetical protein